MSKMKSPLNLLKPISLSEPPKVLFLGNGINRLNFSGARNISLENLLKELREDLADKHILENLPFPLQVQCLRHLSNEDYDKKITVLALDWCNEVIKADKQHVIKAILSHNFDAVLTTNYSYEIEKTLQPDVNKEFVKKEDYSLFYDKKKKSVFFQKYRKFVDGGESPKIKDILHCFLSPNDDGSGTPYLKTPYVWHIHGEAAKRKHIVLDLHSYGNNLSEIQGYISKFIRRVMSSVNKNEVYKPKSWVDYFLLGNVSIVGFSFDFNEFDLWWLLDERRRVIEILQQRLKENSLKYNKKIDINFGDVTFYEAIVSSNLSEKSFQSVANAQKNSIADSKNKISDFKIKEEALLALKANYEPIRGTSYEDAYEKISVKMNDKTKKNKQ